MKKIIRSVCVFAQRVDDDAFARLGRIAGILAGAGFEIQTKRLCVPDIDAVRPVPADVLISCGKVSPERYAADRERFVAAPGVSFTIDFGDSVLTLDNTGQLFDLVRASPIRTFEFAYGFNLPSSSPYFPSACHATDGFSVGLQPTDLAEGCQSAEEWFVEMEKVWDEVDALLAGEEGYLGIDSSVAPLFGEGSSLVGIVRRFGLTFPHSVTTDFYARLSAFIKGRNPRPVGLCGIMLPCLEDFILADEYEKGEFTIERNLFLSLHSGLGIDTYPIGIDESPERVLEILRLVRRLSDKYEKPLAVRFVSDGKAKIGERTDFRNKYLKDVIIRPL